MNLVDCPSDGKGRNWSIHLQRVLGNDPVEGLIRQHLGHFWSFCLCFLRNCAEFYTYN